MSIEEEKRSLLERKRNILYLISQYLDDYGLTNTNAMLLKEANLQNNNYQICDNIDLDSIYLDYCSYYQIKFNKLPKILKKIEQNSVDNFNNNNNNRKSANIKRKTFQNCNQPGNNINCNNTSNNPNDIEIIKKEEISLNSSLIVSPLTNNNMVNNNIKQQQNRITSLSQSQCSTILNGFNDNNNNLLIRPLRDFENYTPEWKEMAQFVCRDIIKKNFSIKWDQVYGHNDVKSLLKEGVLLPLQYPDLFVGIAKPWKGILLHGPPGTGKTLIAKALCTESIEKITFFSVSSSTIISKWRGESEKYIRVLFEVAKFYSPSVIFIDEIDGLASKRDVSSEHEATKRFKNEFLIQIDSLDDEKTGVLLLANTNLPWEIDAAFLRRFERKILIGLPNQFDRINIIKEFMPIAQKWTDKILLELSEISDGFTGDDIRIACKEASMKKIRQALKFNKNKNNDQKAPRVEPITIDEFKQSLKQIQPGSLKLIEKHQDWFKKYGNQLDI